MLPFIPGDFKVILGALLVRAVYEKARDFIQDDLPRLAEEQEDNLTLKLTRAHVGDDFQSFPIVAETANTVTLLARFVDKGVPGLENLKLRLVRAEIEIDRRVNLTTSSQPPVFVRRIPAFTIEIVEESKTHQIAIGGGFDKGTGTEQYRVGIRWDKPEIYFRGLLAVCDKGGFLIDVHAASDFCIPIAATGLGLKGAGLLYGEHFAPDLRDPGSTETAVARMERATAGEYIDWARENDLERWAPVPQDIRTFGVNATLCDILSSGNIVVIEDAGFAFIDYGPVLVFGGRLKVLKTADVGDLLGAVDLRSKTFFGRSSISLDVIPWAPGKIIFSGVNELSASLHDQDKTWWAMGGYAMQGCRLSILGFLELWGGMRIVPLQGAAVRGGGRAEGKIEFIGTGAGYSLAIEASAHFGWNPFELGGNLRVSGDAWLKIFGHKLGAGISRNLRVQVPQPLQLRLDVEFRLSLPWPLSDKTFRATVFNLSDEEVHRADAPIVLAAGAPLAYIHFPSGTLGELTATADKVWPDVAFDLAFQRNAAGPRMIVNPPSLAGTHDEGGVTVSHRISQIGIAKLDAQDHETLVPGVSASWLLSNSGGASAATNRLAIPCNNPLAWLNSFDYAEPDTATPVETFMLQTFGAGSAEGIPVDPATNLARLHVERLVVESHCAMTLVDVPWAGEYGRLLGGGTRYAISVQGPEPGGNLPLPVRVYELRVIDAEGREPSINPSGGAVTGATIVQCFDDGTCEWAITIGRQPSEFRDPLEVGNGDNDLCLAAVGYQLDGLTEIDGGTHTVLAPGRYRLHLVGESVARRGRASELTDWAIVREFEVIRPPLLPYLRFATFGDERAFGLEAAGWNPNPRGSGFGHYKDHLGVIRARVSYLSKIYDRLWVSPREDIAPRAVPVQPARDATLAGSRTSREWEVITGQAPAPEEELMLELPADTGMALARVYFSVDGSGNDIDPDDDVPLGQWTYRVSAYADAVEHLQPARAALAWEVGPFGARRMDLAPGAPVPAGFDFGASPPAKLSSDWPLATELARLADLGDANAGLGFLKLLEWCGVFHVSATADENILLASQAPEIGVLRDAAASPVGLVLRTSEPCDWRRVTARVVFGDLAGVHQLFSVRLAPSGDGCACILLLEADGVAMRVPSGALAIEICFALARAGLPRLTRVADTDQADEVFSFVFKQPFGPAWPL